MNQVRSSIALLVLFGCTVWLASCSKEPAQQPAQQAAAPTQQSQQPQAQAPAATPETTQPPAAAEVSAPTAAAPGTTTAGTATTEKYRLYITNYAKTPLTVSLNGEWVGQWDTHADVPLETAVRGKNDVTVELQGEPNNELKVSVYTKRGGQDVYLVSLNFQGKTGTHKFAFVGK